MKIISKSISLDSYNYHKKHLYIINPMLPIQMTDKEIEVLSAFMSLSGDLSKDPFSTTGRKIVKDKLSLSFGGLGNYLRGLKNKGFIIEKDKLEILPVLIPEPKVQYYNFKLLKDE